MGAHNISVWRHNGEETMDFKTCLLSGWSCFEVECAQEWRRRPPVEDQW